MTTTAHQLRLTAPSADPLGSLDAYVRAWGLPDRVMRLPDGRAAAVWSPGETTVYVAADGTVPAPVGTVAAIAAMRRGST